MQEKKMTEIERKFLVKNDSFKQESYKNTYISQGYLNSTPQRTVRVRRYGDEGFLTIKGVSDEGGTTRFEWEKKIEIHEAEALLKLCEPGMVTKTRFLIKNEKHVFEVDEFYEEKSRSYYRRNRTSTPRRAVCKA